MAGTVNTDELETAWMRANVSRVVANPLNADARSREIGEAIENLVSRDVELSTSIIGMGLDALATTLINNPAKMRELGGWLRLINAVEGYVESGERDDLVDSLLDGTLNIRVLG